VKRAQVRQLVEPHPHLGRVRVLDRVLEAVFPGADAAAYESACRDSPGAAAIHSVGDATIGKSPPEPVTFQTASARYSQTRRPEMTGSISSTSRSKCVPKCVLSQISGVPDHLSVFCFRRSDLLLRSGCQDLNLRPLVLRPGIAASCARKRTWALTCGNVAAGAPPAVSRCAPICSLMTEFFGNMCGTSRRRASIRRPAVVPTSRNWRDGESLRP